MVASIDWIKGTYQEAREAYACIGCKASDQNWSVCSKFDLDENGAVSERDYFCYKSIKIWLSGSPIQAHEKRPCIPLGGCSQEFGNYGAIGGTGGHGIWFCSGHPWYNKLAKKFIPEDSIEDGVPDLEGKTPTVEPKHVAVIVLVFLVFIGFLLFIRRKRK